MSKNYKIGSKVRITSNQTNGFEIGEIVTLVSKRADGLFEMDNGAFQQTLYDDQFELVCEPSSSKLKPAKQALADAIHQNGGWPNDARWTLATSNGLGHVFCWTDKPHRDTWNWTGGTRCISIATLGRIIPNWHQCILSRDEYFTAYPEQVKVEVNNETEQNVEAEMKSESEMTIKIGDWHKNGELPPVGVFVDVVGDDLVYGDNESNCEVIAHVENTAVIRMSYGLGCFGSGAIIPARTERDNAIDEMINVGGLRARDGAREVFGRLYDAGMYKEVK